MWPRLRVTMPGRIARVTNIRPFTLVSTICSQASISALWAGSSPSARPALFTTTSISASSAGKARTACSTAGRSRTSSTSVCRRSVASSPASAFRRSCRRPEATTRCPPATNFFVIAAPKPALAPVTKTVIDMPQYECDLCSGNPRQALRHRRFCRYTGSLGRDWSTKRGSVGVTSL
jgi:hypothetical protein